MSRIESFVAESDAELGPLEFAVAKWPTACTAEAVNLALLGMAAFGDAKAAAAAVYGGHQGREGLTELGEGGADSGADLLRVRTTRIHR
jgi:hypothetical protein